MTCQEIDLDNFSEELLKFGADLNAVDVEGHSAIHFCALYGRNETAKILVS
jgi:ankyrin repeat protein